MAIPIDKSALCQVLVGRDAYIDLVRRLLEQASEGKGHTVLIAGEAGIGKSRLVAEVRKYAESQRLLALEGSCFTPDRSLPYAPILDLLRAFFISLSPERLSHCLGSAASEIAKLTPEITVLLPSVSTTPALEPEVEKRRLFASLVQFLASLSRAQPALVVVEDLHWSDDTSLEFLLYLARRIASLPVLLVLTYRTDEVHLSLRHCLIELNRQRIATELELPPLTIAEVDAMVRAIFNQQHPLRPDFLNAIHGLTEGNPFFIEEVLKSLVSSGDIFYADGRWERKPVSELRIPRSVQDAVQRRVDLVSPPARQALAVAAVVGRRLTLACCNH